jgi:hypothetical protein
MHELLNESQQSNPYLARDGKDLVRETRAEITGGVYGNPCGASQAKNNQLNHQADVKSRQGFVQGNELRVEELHLRATSHPLFLPVPKSCLAKLSQLCHLGKNTGMPSSFASTVGCTIQLSYLACCRTCKMA